MAVEEGGKCSMLDATLQKMRMENRVGPGVCIARWRSSLSADFPMSVCRNRSCTVWSSSQDCLLALLIKEPLEVPSVKTNVVLVR